MKKGNNKETLNSENRLSFQDLPLGDETFLTEKQAEQLFPWSRKTFANKRFRGEGPPYHKHGRNVYYSFGDLRDYFKQGRVVPANEQHLPERRFEPAKN